MDTAGSSPAFHQYFKQHVNDVQSQIDSLSRPDLSAESRKAMTENIVASLTKVSAALADAASGLASYDQRSYNQTVKALQDQLITSQAMMAPKTKFSFKNKRLTAGTTPTSLYRSGQQSHLLTGSPGPASDADSAATSGSATPIHLQDSEDGDMRTRSPIPPMAPPPLHSIMADLNQNKSENVSTESWTSPTSGDKDLGTVVSSRNSSYVSLEILRRQTASGSGQVASVAGQEHLNSQLCVVSRISRSIINLEPIASDRADSLSSLTLTALESTLLTAPTVDGPVHMTNVRNSMLILSCRQFRMHDSHNVTVYLHCTSRPIIEDCTGIHFAELPTLFKHASFPQTQNIFDQVDDFKWLRAEPSPNWNLLREAKQVAYDAWAEVIKSMKELDNDPDIESSKLEKTVGLVLSTLGIGISISS